MVQRRVRRTGRLPWQEEVAHELLQAAAEQPGGLQGPEEAFAAAHPQPWVATEVLERVARQVVGVEACWVIRDGDVPLPRQVRVVVHGSRRSAVARDIQSAWYALWGLYVPRSHFVVTAVRSRLDLLSERRLQLRRLEVLRDRDHGAVATVVLFGRGRLFEGQARAEAPLDTARLAAEAAVRALAVALGLGRGGDDPIALLDVRRTELGGVRALVAAVVRQGAVLLGISAMGADPAEAAVRAVLDATNRVASTVPGTRGWGPLTPRAIPGR